MYGAVFVVSFPRRMQKTQPSRNFPRADMTKGINPSHPRAIRCHLKCSKTNAFPKRCVLIQSFARVLYPILSSTRSFPDRFENEGRKQFGASIQSDTVSPEQH